MVHAEHTAEHHGHHIVPKPLLLKVFLALVGLTILTVATAQVDLGPLNVPLALAIASSKATLVVLFFMALKYDRPINTLVFSIGVLFVIVFLTFTLFDTVFRGDLGNVGADTIMDTRRAEEALLEAAPAPEAEHVVPADSAAAAADTTAAAPADAAETDTTAAGE